MALQIKFQAIRRPLILQFKAAFHCEIVKSNAYFCHCCFWYCLCFLKQFFFLAGQHRDTNFLSLAMGTKLSRIRRVQIWWGQLWNSSQATQGQIFLCWWPNKIQERIVDLRIDNHKFPGLWPPLKIWPRLHSTIRPADMQKTTLRLKETYLNRSHHSIHASCIVSTSKIFISIYSFYTNLNFNA